MTCYRSARSKPTLTRIAFTRQSQRPSVHHIPPSDLHTIIIPKFNHSTPDHSTKRSIDPHFLFPQSSQTTFFHTTSIPFPDPSHHIAMTTTHTSTPQCHRFARPPIRKATIPERNARLTPVTHHNVFGVICNSPSHHITPHYISHTRRVPGSIHVLF